MQTKLYELSGRKASTCQTRRKAALLRTDEKKHMRMSYIIKSDIRRCMDGELTLIELADELDKEFEDIEYMSEKQKNIKAADAYKEIFRYVSSEYRKRYPGKKKDIRLNDDLLVLDVRPDAIYWEPKTASGPKTLNVVRWKCKKPDLSQKAAADSMELFTLLKYGRTLVKPGETIKIVASIYFLRKKNDSTDEEKACFDTDFFEKKGGLNIVDLTEVYTKPVASTLGIDDDITDTDKHFAPIIKSFIEGTPEEECDKTDCANCEYAPICRFTEPPMRLKEKKKAKGVSVAKLTPQQKEAREYEKGICRINAGAGAGKTFTVAWRVVSLLNKGVKPEEIFITTFTNAGAKELRERIQAYAEDDGIAEDVDISKMMIMTFNAFGDMIIKKEYKRFGYTEEPHLIDDVERYKIVADMIKKDVVSDLDYRNFEVNEHRTHGAVATAAEAFRIFKKNPTKGYSDLDEMHKQMNYNCSKKAFRKLYKMYRDYDDHLRDNCLMEYSDQENLIFELLGMDPYYFDKFHIKHIIVDEFQDSSERQIEIIKRLTNCPDFQSLMVVGDDSQAIYSFRDTTPYFIINFDKVMGCNVDDIQLLENHRSTPEIIEFANKINAMNRSRIPKDLIATRPHGEPVTVQGFLTSDEEQTFVVDKIEEYVKKGTCPEDIAVLARNKSEVNKIADLLSKKGIPSVIQFPERILENSRVLGAVSMFRAITNPLDLADLTIYANVLKHGALKNASEEEIDEACQEAEVRTKAYRAVTEEEEKKEAIEELLAELDPNKDDDVYQAFVTSLMYRKPDKMADYVEDFMLFGKNQEVRRSGKYPGVVLSTAHSSKGLEWPICFNMIGGYDKEELHGRKTSSKVARIEEERRLLFVSSTRARDVLYITAKYTSGGKAGDYIYNQFLIDCYHALGKKFSTEKIETERLARKNAEKERKKKEKAEAEARKLNAIA